MDRDWCKMQSDSNGYGDYSYIPIEEEPRTTLHVCPTCKGSGFFDGVLPPIEFKEAPKSAKPSQFAPDCELPVALPKIKCPLSLRPKPNQLTRSSSSTVETLPLLPTKKNRVPQFGATLKTRSNPTTQEEKLPSIRNSKSRMSSNSSEGGGDIDLIEPREIDNKPDFIRRTKVKLKSSNLLEISEGVIDVVHLAKVDETAAYTFMPQVNRHLCEMLRSLKVKIVRQACQAIAQLFGRVSHVSRPEFDDIVVLLLIRTADSKKFVRKDATSALDVIVASTPPQVVVRAIHAKGPRSKNPHVRLTTAKIMCTLVRLVGYETLLSHPALHEMRKRVLETGCILLDDQNGDVRYKILPTNLKNADIYTFFHFYLRSVGRDLMSNFVTLGDFEEALLSDVPQQLIKRVEKSIICLRVELLKSVDILKTSDIPLQ
ncbi:uncharacterized protein LOC106663086 isoform X2 [Cimex lectularius]|uniref:TOG domain-containing protein n=1 Tax=Cimex lectularius TaxID=79782 RepID=A0A8I6SKN6_CIMLE|nr:uncharacterized protein LOC106663086 isoform X2 [Cimex lectularius]